MSIHTCFADGPTCGSTDRQTSPRTYFCFMHAFASIDRCCTFVGHAVSGGKPRVDFGYCLGPRHQPFVSNALATSHHTFAGSQRTASTSHRFEFYRCGNRHHRWACSWGRHLHHGGIHGIPVLRCAVCFGVCIDIVGTLSTCCLAFGRLLGFAVCRTSFRFSTQSVAGRHIFGFVCCVVGRSHCAIAYLCQRYFAWWSPSLGAFACSTRDGCLMHVDCDAGYSRGS